MPHIGLSKVFCLLPCPQRSSDSFVFLFSSTYNAALLLHVCASFMAYGCWVANTSQRHHDIISIVDMAPQAIRAKKSGATKNAAELPAEITDLLQLLIEEQRRIATATEGILDVIRFAAWLPYEPLVVSRCRVLAGNGSTLVYRVSAPVTPSVRSRLTWTTMRTTKMRMATRATMVLEGIVATATVEGPLRAAQEASRKGRGRAIGLKIAIVRSTTTLPTPPPCPALPAQS